VDGQEDDDEPLREPLPVNFRFRLTVKAMLERVTHYGTDA
jgi:hypothetical protein